MPTKGNLFAVTLTAWSSLSVAGPLDAASFKEYGGTYSTDCGNAKALVLRVAPDRIAAIRENRGLLAKDLEEQLTYFGQNPPKGFLSALVGQVQSGVPMIFLVYEDKRSKYIVLDGDPKVLKTLGLPSADKSRYFKCPASGKQS